MSKRVFNEIKQNLSEIKMFPHIKVTPVMASDLLALNTANRRKRQWLVDDYAKQMKEGKWEFNGDCIILSSEGVLLDGQHRLEAIVESETMQMFNIQTGISPDAFPTIDTGVVRGGADAIQGQGYTNAAALAGMVRMIVFHEKYGLSRKGGGNVSTRIHNNELVEWLNSHEREYTQDILNRANVIYRKSKLMTGSTVAGLLYIFAKPNRTDLQKATEFFEKVYSGEDISMSHNTSIYLLREKLIQWKTSSFDIVTDVKIAHIIKAWNYFKTGRSVRRLAWAVNEEFPTIN